MTELPIKATDWHKKPRRTQGPCPICGYPRVNNPSHRAMADLAKHRWETRRKTPNGWRYERIGRKDRKPMVRVNLGPSPKTEQKLALAASLIARGETVGAVQDRLGVGHDWLRDARNRWPALWTALMDKARAATAEAVRRMAGTDAIFTDPEAYLAMAGQAQKWAEARGEALFTAEAMTLGRFYREVFLDRCCAPDLQRNTRVMYDLCVKRWVLVTGDPPLDQITGETLARFRRFLMESPGGEPGSLASPSTVQNYLRYISAMLGKAGPPGPGNRDAVGLIQVVPFIRLPRANPRPIRIVSPHWLSAVYDAAAAMVVPAIPGIEPGAWWQALLVVAYNTGLRRRTLFALDWAHVQWNERLFAIPAQHLKARRVQYVPLNDVVVEHLERIRRAEGLVFEWPHCRSYFNDTFKMLQWRAGVPMAERFGLHQLRKTCATKLWEASPEAAQLMLGHTKADVTMRHYVQAKGIVAAAVETMPQPAAFQRKRHGEPEVVRFEQRR
jgi:integrase